jgi:hypothetical protein
MKKRLLSLLLALVMVLGLCPTAFAANNSYRLDELGMSIEIPSDHVVFTRDIKSNDPNLSAYGLTKNGMYSLMLERNIYLNAWDEDVNYEIIVTMVDSPLGDYSQLSDTTLSALASSLASEYESVGITYLKSEIYQHNQAKFVKIYISQPNNGSTAYGLQYHTVYDGKAINITLQSYSGKIGSTQEAIIKKIVNSLRFDKDPQPSKEPERTPSFLYTDKESGVSFTVPENWVESPMTEEREYLDAKFTSTLEEGLAILFMVEDAWANLTAAEKSLYPRADANNSLLSKADIADMLGCKEQAVSMATLSGKEYFCAEFIGTGAAYGLTMSAPMTCLLRCENGYLFMFQFSGHRSNSYYNDFIALVSSVNYPTGNAEKAEISTNPSETNNPTSPTKEEKNGSTIAIVLISISVIAVAVVLIVIVSKRRSKPKSGKSPVISAPTYESHPKAAVFCHKCGNKLPLDSKYCNVCGTKIPDNL